MNLPTPPRPDDSRALQAAPVTTVLSTSVIEPAPRLCQNCQTSMHGPFCYQCGQHERSSLRHAGLLLRDILHDVLNLDSRAIRTLKPLLLKPGYLTQEYFAGRRQRYVPPLRLYVIASLVFFLVAGLTFSLGDGLQFDGDKAAAEAALNDPEVQKALQDPQTEAALKRIPALREALDAKQAPAVARPPMPSPSLPVPDVPAPADKPGLQVSLLDEVPFLPAAANQWLKELNAEVKLKAQRIQEHPQKLAEAVLAVLPQSMFILLPLFALLLKLFYPFANRLYMEHLIVALHSHSFLFILFTLLIGANQIVDQGVAAHAQWQWLPNVVGSLSGLLLAFGVPGYLYLMQKRVYGQGHWLTASKFVLIGTLYLTLLSLVIAVDIIVGILRM